MFAVSELFVYPIKSCRGISVAAATVGSRGLEHDRRWMLVDANGRFLTQRRHPRMALIDVRLEESTYEVTAPSMPPLIVPHTLTDETGGTECKVRIWRDTVEATMAQAEVNIWFSEFLGFACGLVHLADHQHRPVPNEASEFDDEVSFADGAPLLLITTASLDGLNHRLERPISMRRFRPNLVVTADVPHAEDDWRSITVGSVTFAVAWSSARCILTTLDPDTGERASDGEPLTTLRTYRTEGRQVTFGQNLIPRAVGRIAVGDEVSVEQQ